MNFLPFERDDSAALQHLCHGSGSSAAPSSYPKEESGPIDSKAGNPLGLGKCRCIMLWLLSALGPVDPLRLCSNRLARMALCF